MVQVIPAQLIFGFALAICFDPFTWTGATSPRWALLAVALPLCCAFQSRNHFTLAHLIGTVFIAWAALTLTWTENWWDGTSELIQLVFIALAFLYGSRLLSVDRIFVGLAIGITISSLILLIPPLHNLPSIVLVYPHGLFGNRNMLAEAAVLTALGCIAYKRYWFIPGLIPSIIWQPVSRGAILALVAGLSVWLWPRSRAATILLGGALLIAACTALGMDYRISSVTERLEVWQTVLSGVTLSGHGIGSLYTLMPYMSSGWDTTLVRVDHAHNEALEILFELGLPGLVLYLGLIAYAIGCARAETGLLAVLCGFLVISCVAFPWHIPTNAFIGALVLGHAVRNGTDIRDLYADSRAFIRAGLASARANT